MSRRAPLVIVGAVVLAFAGLVALVGVVLATAFGSGTALATGPHPATTPTRALVFPMAGIDGLSAAPPLLGPARIDVEATARTTGAGVFVGVGRAVDVDRYLAGADVDVVTDIEVSPFRLTTRHRPGGVVTAAPDTQDFWVARAEAGSGTARLSWSPRDGDYQVVFMNADGSPAVDVDGRFALVLPSAMGISLILLASGLGMALLGGLALTLGLLASRNAASASSSGGAAPPLVPAPASSGSSPGEPTVAGSAADAQATTATPERIRASG